MTPAQQCRQGGAGASATAGPATDPFFDRDLDNFRLLFDLRAISVGVIVTRGDELQEIFKETGRGSSYGASTTHMSKLLPKIEGGGAAGCPLLVFGITKRLYREDDA